MTLRFAIIISALFFISCSMESKVNEDKNILFAIRENRSADLKLYTYSLLNEAIIDSSFINIPKENLRPCSGAYYNFQVDSLLNNGFISLCSENVEGIIDYSKLIKYDFKKNTFVTLAEFEEPILFWKYLEQSNSIIFHSNKDYAYKLIDVKTKKIKTLESLNGYTRPSQLQQTEGYLFIYDARSAYGKPYINELKINTTDFSVSNKKIMSKLFLAGVHSQYYIQWRKKTVRVYKDKKIISEKKIDLKNLSTKWDTDSTFFLLKRNTIEKYDISLNLLDSFAIESPYIVDIIHNYNVVKGDRKLYLIDTDLNFKIPLDFIDFENEHLVRSIELK